MSLALRRILCLLSTTVAVAGCTPSANGPVPPANAGGRPVALSQAAAPNDAGPKDAPAPQQILFQVDVYQLAVPMGTFSRNEAFWKRIDEQCVDVTTHDVLEKNGIRVGQAPLADLDFFRGFMDEKKAMHKFSISGFEARDIELEMGKDLPQQTIFHFDGSNQMIGRDYDRSSNIINLSFQPTPRRPGDLRVDLCPVVRTYRRHFEFTQIHEEREIQYVNSELFYDLNLRTDIGKGKFFIVMPSPDARFTTSVGHAFFGKDGKLGREEQIILIIPNPVRVTQPEKR